MELVALLLFVAVILAAMMAPTGPATRKAEAAETVPGIRVTEAGAVPST
jgi:hypothetical protein